MKKRLLALLTVGMLMTSSMGAMAADAESVSADDLEAQTYEVSSNYDYVEVENNDTMADATILEKGKRVYGELGSYEVWKHQKDVEDDWYKVRLSEGVSYRLELEGYCANYIDTTFLIGMANDSGADVNKEVVVLENGKEYSAGTLKWYFKGSNTDSITIKANVTGDYYIRLWNYIDFSRGRATDYIISCTPLGEDHSGNPKKPINPDPNVPHAYIKGQCQLPYSMVAPGQPGYLIGFQTYNSDPNYRYEMMIYDCTAQAWVYRTGASQVPEDCFWTVWQPEYGYFWTLFVLTDARTGEEIDRVCYGFQNIY